MDSEQIFWIKIWAIIGTVVVAIGGITLIYALHNDMQMARLIAKGADPIRVRCALDTLQLDPACIILLSREGGTK